MVMITTQKQRDSMKIYYQKHKSILKKDHKKYYEENKGVWKKTQDTDKYRKEKVWYNRQIREKALLSYGGKCECCGEDKYEFLCIDHINGGGKKHRDSIKGSIYQWLKKNNYPKGFRVLCHNCNLSLGFYKFCPHNSQI